MGIPLNIDPDKQPFELYEDIDYKRFWSGWQQRKLDQAEHAVVQIMLPKSGRRILDLGCGYGRLSDCYLGRFSQIVMYDGSLPFLKEACQRTDGKAIYIAGDIQRLPFRAGSFDSITMIRVLHHIQDDKSCLSELHRILSDGGMLVFTYRNKMYLKNVLSQLTHPERGGLFSLEPSGVETTLISHHPEYIRRQLHNNGFTNLRHQGLGVFDRIANMIKPWGKFAPTGKRLAPVFGKIKIAPWMFCSAIARGNTDLIKSENIDDLLMCLVCSGDVKKDVNSYKCISCGQNYPIVDGILDFRVS